MARGRAPYHDDGEVARTDLLGLILQAMTVRDRSVRIDLEPFHLEGTVRLPDGAWGLVLFVHGSGRSEPGRRVPVFARVCEESGLATLILDLVTQKEEELDEDWKLDRPNIDLLAARAAIAADFAAADPELGQFPLVLVGMGAAASSALVTAAERGARVAEVVSYDGWPGEVEPELAVVTSPTLLLALDGDPKRLEANERVLPLLPAPGKALRLVAGSRSADPAIVEAAAREATAWVRALLA